MGLIGSQARRLPCVRRLRVPLIAAAVLMTMAASIFAQENMSPTPMSTPEVMLMPAVALFPYPAYGTAPMTVGFIPQIHDPAGQEVVSYKWNFGDGHVATTPPLVTYNIYQKPGVYVASLTITTADGRSATGFASVTVKAPETTGGQSG
jgi:PKD repeat protein